jgi:hypothetical protein
MLVLAETVLAETVGAVVVGAVVGRAEEAMLFSLGVRVRSRAAGAVFGVILVVLSRVGLFIYTYETAGEGHIFHKLPVRTPCLG